MVLFPLTVSVGRGSNAALCFGVTSVIDTLLIETVRIFHDDDNVGAQSEIAIISNYKSYSISHAKCSRQSAFHCK